MNPWNQGSTELEDLLEAKDIERRPGADAGTHALIARAHQQIESARSLLQSDPVTAYVIVYDAARHAGAALLAEQNLRATTTGGHVAIERALAAQFGGTFTRFRNLRRRRHELDYPASDEDFADEKETALAIDAAAVIVQDAQTVIDKGILTQF